MMQPAFPIGAVVRGPTALVERGTSWQFRDFPVRYGLFEHPREGLVLIDTGYTEQLFGARGASIALYRQLLRPRLDPDQLPMTRIAALGASAADVRHVLLTHLHADHVCGTPDFTKATFYVSRPSIELFERGRLLEQHRQSLYPGLLPADFKSRCRLVEDTATRLLPGGLGSGFDVFGDGSSLVVPLPGHMAGHYGVLWPEGPRPLLYGVDAAWTMTGLRANPIPPPPLRWILASQEDVRASARKIAAFADGGGDVILCHDPVQDPRDAGG